MTSTASESEIHDVWSHYWATKKDLAAWDSLSEIILRTIEREARRTNGNAILEAGCGTGRISYQLALAGADLTCLDITAEALQLAVGTFGSTPAKFVQASILDVPTEQQFDIVWNAGVLEHFVRDDQERAISEFLSILKPGGRVVILTPYSRSLLYRLGKFVLEALGRWPYGIEVPKGSLADCLPSTGILEEEYTIAFLPLFFDAHKFFSPLRPVLTKLWSLVFERLGPQRVLNWDRTLSQYLGGYLLVSVIRPK